MAAPSISLPERGSRNRLLSQLTPESYDRIRARSEHLSLPQHFVLYEPNVPISHAYFLDSGIASVIAKVEGGDVETGSIGYEGFVGIPLVFGVARDSFHGVIQVAGEGLRMSALDFRSAVAADGALRSILLLAAYQFGIQVAFGSACNRLHTVDERCARWLLITHDRTRAEPFSLTQQYLATMLGVRRAGVSVALGVLRQAGLIEVARTQIRVIDRTGLERASCGCYKLIRDSYPAERA